VYERAIITTAAIIIGALVMIEATRTPRGIRNNNPGNIRANPANQWKGQTGQDRGGYAIFSEPRFGVRAMARTLDSYYYRRGLDSIEGIIHRWAPPGENLTRAYVADVSQRLQIQPGTRLPPVVFEAVKPALIRAIIWHENGQNPYTIEQIRKWAA